MKCTRQGCNNAALPGMKWCEFHRAQHRRNSDDARARNREQGLCRECNQPADGGTIFCVTHRQRTSERTQRLYARRKLDGCCTNCGVEQDREGCLCSRCAKTNIDRLVRINAENRAATFDILGRACKCCGEDRLIFLAVDHVNNDGAYQRKELKLGTQKLYKQILKHRDDAEFLSQYQTLCHNCNWAKAHGGCPHQADG